MKKNLGHEDAGGKIIGSMWFMARNAYLFQEAKWMCIRAYFYLFCYREGMLKEHGR